MSENLTASELEHLRALLQRFAEHDLDQHENLRSDTHVGLIMAGRLAHYLASYGDSEANPALRHDDQGHR